jgi:hypothetical protein
MFYGIGVLVFIGTMVTAGFFLSATGAALEKLLDVNFFTSLLGAPLVPLLVGLVLAGVGMGGLASAVARMPRGMAALVSGIAALVVLMPTVFFFREQFLAFAFLGIAFAVSVVAAAAWVGGKETGKFGAGHEFVKKVFLVFSVLSFLAVVFVVNADRMKYEDSFKESLSSFAAQTTGGLSKADLRSIINAYQTQPQGREELRPLVESQVTDGFMRSQVQNWDSLSPEQQEQLKSQAIEQLLDRQWAYVNSAEYKAAVEKQINAAVDRMYEQFKSGGGVDTADILQRLPFFEKLIELLPFLYAFTFTSVVLFFETIVIAPVAGAASFVILSLVPKQEKVKT